MKPKKSSWIVTMECTVTKEVVCKDCTKEEARINPWEYAEDEKEIQQIDWHVEMVEENV